LGGRVAERVGGSGRGPWFLLATLVACATTSRATYNQTRATEHVYLSTPDVLLGAASKVLSEQGLAPQRVARLALQTTWTSQGVQAPPATTPGDIAAALQKGPEPRSYQSYRVLVTALDATHQTVRIDRLTLIATETAIRSMGARFQENKDTYVADPGGRDALAQQAASDGPGRDVNPPAQERQPAMEWGVLQKVDPTAATFIEQEPTVVSGCGQVRAPLAAPPAVVQIASSCPDVPGAIDLLASRRLIVLGELHGTEQSPAFVGTLACRTAAEGWPVAIALELPQQDNPALQTYLGSQGTASDREVYISTSTWKRDWEDGRSTAAMFALVEQLRALKAAGAALEVEGIDDRRYLGNDREAAMATLVETMRRRLLDRPMVVLVGNIHAQTRTGQVTDDYLPLGSRLDRFGLKPVPLVMAYDAGTAWGCTLEAGFGCGVHPVRGWPPKGASTYTETATERASKGGMGAAGDAAPDTPRFPRSIRLWPHRSEGFDGQYYLGPITASLPP
jgi:hypothetical protein